MLKKEIKCNNVIKIQKIINFDQITKEDIKGHNPNWLQIPDNLYRILIVGGPGSEKSNILFNLIGRQLDIDKICLYTKNPYKAKYQLVIKKRNSAGLEEFNNSKPLLNTQMIWMIYIENID